MSNKFFYPEKKVDYNIFVEEKNKHIAKYNLPPNVEFCKKCLFSNQRATTRVEHNVRKNKDLTLDLIKNILEDINVELV